MADRKTLMLELTNKKYYELQQQIEKITLDIRTMCRIGTSEQMLQIAIINLKNL